MTEAKRQTLDAEEERVGRVWGSGAWRDILPHAFYPLPPRERFVVQRVSRLFQGASERARLAVGQLKLSDINLTENDTKDIKFTAKILNPNASVGITSLLLPNDSRGLDRDLLPEIYCISQQVVESRLENSRRKCEEALAKLSLPTLKHVSLCTWPLTRSPLPFLRRHPTISSAKLTITKDCNTDRHWKEAEMVAEALSEAKIRRLTILVFEGSIDFKDWRTNLFDNVEELSLEGVDLCHLNFLPDPSKLISFHYEIDYRKLNTSVLDQAPRLRCLALIVWWHLDIELAKHLRRFPLESLTIIFYVRARDTGHVRAIIEYLASGGEASSLAISLQELTVSVLQSSESFDMSVFDTDAFLRFPRLHSLRLRLETWGGRGPTLAERNALSAQPVFTELKGRLRVLEIAAVGEGRRLPPLAQL